jgi:hypothetical protein
VTTGEKYNWNNKSNLTLGETATTAAKGNHTHNYAGSSSAGGAATSANKVNNSLTIKLNSGTTEGTDKFTFNGSEEKTLNITPNRIGAAASDHVHTIDGIMGTTINRFAVCSTEKNVAEKQVHITSGSFTLEVGARLTVKFDKLNIASNPTLKVDNLSAKNIFHKGAQITTGSNKNLLAGVVDFVYDGTQFHLVGNYINPDAASTTTAGLMPKLSDNANDFLNGKGVWVTVYNAEEATF